MVTNLRDDHWYSLHQQLRGIAKRRAALDAEEARCLRAADALRLWRRLGYIHMNEYLERELGYGPQAGIERLRVARELGGLPRTEASLADGALAYSAVRELTRIATAETEGAWLAEARGKNLRQIEAMVSGRKRGDRPCDPTNPDLVNRVVRLELSPEVFALFRQVQGAMADEHGGRLDDSAFVETLCRRALERAAASERPAHQIAITVCKSCDRGWQDGAGREIEVGPEVIARARCDAELIGSLDAEQPARVTATITPRIRRQVLARDHHRCTVAGCRSARNLDLHHIVYQGDGGGHELWNITAVCAGHHKQLHDGALTIRGKAPDGLEFAWRDPAEGRVGGEGIDHERREPVVSVVDREAREAPAAAADEARAVVAGAKSHVGDGGAPEQMLPAASEALTTAGDEASAARAAVETAPPHVGDQATLAQRIREARAALTTSGYKAHAARVAVETARSHVGDQATLAQRIREAREALTTAVDEAPAAVANVKSHVGNRGAPEHLVHKASEAPTTAGGEAPAARMAVETARSHVGDQATLAQRIREAREALTTAGYKAHAAGVAVETARSHVGDQATLAQLIREALRCCAMLGRA